MMGSEELTARAKWAIDDGIKSEPSRQIVTSLSMVLLEVLQEYKIAIGAALRIEDALHGRTKGEDMRQGIQTFFGEVGEAACYALDLIDLALEGLGDSEIGVPAQLLAKGIAKGCIHYDWDNPEDNDNFYVNDPEGFLYEMTGRKWSVRKEPPEYVLVPGEMVIERWERQVTGQVMGHFRRPKFDSVLDSKTVKFGRLVSLRICKMID